MDHHQDRINKLTKDNTEVYRKTQRLLNQLTQEEKSDPFEYIFNSIKDKNMELNRLRQSVSELQSQLKKVQPAYQTNQEMRDFRSTQTLSKKQTIDDNLTQARSQASQADEKALGFNLLLIKTIWELFNQKQPAEEQQPSAQLTISGKLDTLLDNLSNNGNQTYQSSNRNDEGGQTNGVDSEWFANKTDEEVFSKLSKALGLEERWRRYSGRHYQIVQHVTRLHSAFNLKPNSPQENQKQALNAIKNQFQQFFKKSKLYTESSKQTESLISGIPKFESYFNEEVLRLKQVSEKNCKQCATLINSIHTHYIQSIEKLFNKHNIPLKLTSQSILTHSLQGELEDTLRAGNWSAALERMKTLIDRTLYSMDRRIKWNSNNRLVVIARP